MDKKTGVGYAPLWAAIAVYQYLIKFQTVLGIGIVLLTMTWAVTNYWGYLGVFPLSVGIAFLGIQLINISKEINHLTKKYNLTKESVKGIGVRESTIEKKNQEVNEEKQE